MSPAALATDAVAGEDVRAGVAGADDIAGADKEALAEEALAEQALADYRRRRWKLAPSMGSDFPLGVGAQLRVESPEGVRVSGGFGHVPAGYVDALLAMAGALAGDDPRVEALSGASIDGWIGTFSAGWRPWAHRGWYFSGGYSALKLNGSLNAQDAAIVLFGALGALAPDRNYRATATVHMLRIEAGYTQRLYEGLELSVGFGFAASLYNTTDIEWGFGDADSGSRAAVELQDTLQQYLHLPTLSVALGYEVVGQPVVDTSVHPAPTRKRDKHKEQ